MTLKVSVLASGVILLDGEPIELDALDQKLAAADKLSTAIWYYRETAAEQPPPQAQAVIQLVIKHKLRISLSNKSDFSDYVDANGISHPRAAAVPSEIPNVLVPANIEEILGNIRRIAAGDKGQGGLVILRPDRTYLSAPPMRDNPELKKFAEGLTHLLPPGVQRNVAVIGRTEFGSQTPSVADVNNAIPFFGLLMGLAYLGHAVWVFEGHPSALAAGCRDADALVVDSALISSLPADWQSAVRAVMRSANILVHDRASFSLRVVSKPGAGTSPLEFAS